MIAHVVAMAHNRVIGRQNRLPWHFSSDMQFFKKLTTGHTVIMGRKTYESVGKALPNRQNFVLSRAAAPVTPGVRFFADIDSALKAVRTEHAFIIGGAEVFRQTFDKADTLFITQIDAEYEGDVFYPAMPPEFQEVSREELQKDPRLTVVRYEVSKNR